MSIRQTLVTSFFESLSPGFQNPSKNPGWLAFSSSAFCRTKNCSNLLETCSESISILPFFASQIVVRSRKKRNVILERKKIPVMRMVLFLCGALRATTAG
jgi:hypothetical protein